MLLVIKIMQLIQTLFAIFLPHLIQLQIIILQRIYLLRIGEVFEFCLFQKESVLQKVTQKNLNLKFMILRIGSINSRNYVKLHQTNGRAVRRVLTAEGRTPPNAVYKESFPTGIPIP